MENNMTGCRASKHKLESGHKREVTPRVPWRLRLLYVKCVTHPFALRGALMMFCNGQLHHPPLPSTAECPPGRTTLKSFMMSPPNPPHRLLTLPFVGGWIRRREPPAADLNGLPVSTSTFGENLNFMTDVFAVASSWEGANGWGLGLLNKVPP